MAATDASQREAFASSTSAGVIDAYAALALLPLGGRDEELPSADCFPLLENMKVAGKPLNWHVYPDATHSWDQSLPKCGYVRNAAVTQDATARALAVFAGK
ncbi:MAG: dienelactone hydrolase family protein [Proteobacteria bacterium]|nr:dienelactone hydrolase family protein [Pseudomonadota bacterium]